MTVVDSVNRLKLLQLSCHPKHLLPNLLGCGYILDNKEE
jgi:hypothetical protein